VALKRLDFFLDRFHIFASVSKPVVQMVQYFLRPIDGLHNRVSQGVKDKSIFMEHRIAMPGYLLFLYLAIPLLENVKEKVKMFVAFV
jgi:hypothetical protein